MEDLLQGNKTINHPIITPTYEDKQHKYKIISKDLSIIWRVEVQSKTMRGNILILQQSLFFLNIVHKKRVLILES
jgi:hypothetical protein